MTTVDTAFPEPAATEFASVQGAAGLMLAETSGLLAVDSDGRIPVLLSLPKKLDGLDGFSHTQFNDGQGGTIFAFSSKGSANEISVLLYVQTFVEDPRTLWNSFGYKTVSIGSNIAWVGLDVTKDCGPVPEDGYDDTILMWIEGDVLLYIKMVPVPECQTSPLSLEEVIEIARGLQACKGFDLAEPDCRPMYK